MGTTLSSIHILSDEAITLDGFDFQSFSDGWQTCISDFSDKNPYYIQNIAKSISKKTDSLVLHFYLFDSLYMHFDFWMNGKIAVKYASAEFIKNKNLSQIPDLLGYKEGYKKRLTHILNCGNIEEKVDMLEEYFGVCLLPYEECFDEPSVLKRSKSDELYQAFMKRNSQLLSKGNSLKLQLVAEFYGKIYYDYFEPLTDTITKKQHCYLFGYETEESEDLKPVRFVGERFEYISDEEFSRDRAPLNEEDNFYDLSKTKPFTLIFNDNAPEQYRNKELNVSCGAYPVAFDKENRLILAEEGKIYIIDENMQIISKRSVKGQVADMVNDYILTTTGLSFCGYCYDPVSAVRIYKLVDKK